MSLTKKDRPGKRRYLSSATRKEEILDAALIEFSSRTYNAVSMERLASCAGLSKAGIYAHFKSKEQILHALLERAANQADGTQGWLPDDDLSLPELVDAYLDRLYTTFRSPATKAVYRVALAESARVPELVQYWHKEAQGRLQSRAQAIIQRYIQRGVIRESVLTEHFFPLALSPALLWLNSAMLSMDNPSIALAELQEIHRRLLLELLSPHEQGKK